jgi:glycosyltransferase involved in cell wall biosynthesis
MADERGSLARDPRVTIAIPCFKQEVFLFECLNSLISQTIPAWQAFVVDDCSPDRAVDRIVGTYNDARIRSIRHDTNRGLAASRNTGLRAGSAPFVLCVDADDFLDPEFLSATLDAIEGKGVDCAYTEYQLIGLSSDVWRWEPKSAHELARVPWLPGPGVVMRRSIWEQAGGYSTELRWNEDWDFWIGVVHRGVSFQRVPRPLYFYRRHAKSRTATLPEMTEWMTREVILKRRAAFFAEGDRARTFCAGGLLASAHANRIAGHRWKSVLLTARAATIDPKLLFSRSLATPRLRSTPAFPPLTVWRKIERRAKSAIVRAGERFFPAAIANFYQGHKKDTSRNWESVAREIHDRYGYLSHDYAVLGQAIETTGARRVLEFGCGSGRLVPVYLMHDLQSIWLHDMSQQALVLCRERFSCQRQIRYFKGNVQSIPMSAAIDLVVTNRVLQHILDDAEFDEVLNYLASMTRYFYVNESGMEAWRRDPYMKARDYIQTFDDLGWSIAAQGELTAEGEARQRWMLFEKRRRT